MRSHLTFSAALQHAILPCSQSIIRLVMVAGLGSMASSVMADYSGSSSDKNSDNKNFNNSKTVYVGRTQPDLRSHDEQSYRDYRHRSQRQQARQRPLSRPAEYPRASISAQLYYQAPSTTTITRNITITPPAQDVGDVYYSQDNYYLYPPLPLNDLAPNHRGYSNQYQPLIPVTIDPKATINRSQQWTDKP